MGVKLSVLMPVYNELVTLDLAVKKDLDADYPCEMELIIVDDGSTDGTRDLYPAITSDPRVVLELHDRNRGKGAAIRTAARIAAGDYVIMCDADLEYSPADIPSLLAPVVAGDAKVVYGSRTFGSHNAYSYLYVLGNRAVTTWANLLFNCYLSDLGTCFRLITDRLGHDLRYSLDDSLLRSMGYAPRIPFHEGLRATVEWYAASRSWWEPLPRPAPPERTG
jgi:glycosyltransferase involved in cell wall biosynthesis